MDDRNHTDCNVEMEEIELNDVELPPNDVTNSNTNNNNNNRYSIPNGGDTSNFNNSNNNNTSNDNNYNRYSSVSSQLTTASSKKSILSNKKELKQLRKPSDRIPSKSLCATFCYNIPRSTLMIILPGIVILITGAILTATADRSESWTDGGVLLVSLVFLILGGFWTLGGLIYWLITWCRYKPEVVKRSQLGTPPIMTASATSASRAINGNQTAVRTSYSDSTSSPTTFESLNSPFTVIPHPIFSQQQLQLSQQQLNSQPTVGQ